MVREISEGGSKRCVWYNQSQRREAILKYPQIQIIN